MKTYTVDEDTLERFGTLEEEDLGRMYIIVKGALHFVENQREADRLELLLAKYGKNQ